MARLLYTKEGTEAAVAIWKEFEAMKYQYERGGDEDEEKEQREEEWGYGELEEIEAEGRRVNGEAELAMRGYGG